MKKLLSGITEEVELSAQNEALRAKLEQQKAELQAAREEVTRLIGENHQLRRSSGAYCKELAVAVRKYYELRQRLEKLLSGTREMRQNSRTDQLTTLPNRHAFIRYISTLLRQKIPFSIVMCDIDHFKRVNDNYGHDAGDGVLRRVSGIIQGNLRHSKKGKRNDGAFRLGGEEFAVILPFANKEEAMMVAERIRQAVEKDTENILVEGESITISLGCAEHDYSIVLADILQHADSALYASKHGGRNRVTAYEEGMEMQDDRRALRKEDEERGVKNKDRAVRARRYSRLGLRKPIKTRWARLPKGAITGIGW